MAMIEFELVDPSVETPTDDDIIKTLNYEGARAIRLRKHVGETTTINSMPLASTITWGDEVCGPDHGEAALKVYKIDGATS